MSNDNKTLADVQPGGSVRPGDQAERAQFEAWAEERELGTAKCSADGMKGDYADLNTDWCWAAWRAALSAQPSPGGQGDALAALQQDYDKLLDSFNRQVEVAEKIAGRALQQDDRIEELEAALAARQTVGEIDEAAVLRRAAAVLDMWEGDSNQTGYMGDFKDAQAILEVLAQNAAPPAQAVDLPYSLDADPAGIRARVADVITGTLMVGAQGHTPPPAGHWAEPFRQAARADAKAQAVDLGQQQDAARWRAIAPHLSVEWDEDEMLKRWTWIDFRGDALSVPTRSRESYSSVEEAIDAVIDSQAGGNG